MLLPALLLYRWWVIWLSKIAILEQGKTLSGICIAVRRLIHIFVSRWQPHSWSANTAMLPINY